MKKLLFLLPALLFVFSIETSAQCCNKNAPQAATIKSCCDTKNADTDVTAYYFHATRRCATCQAVEKVTKETISEHYAGKVNFKSINREENKDNPLLKKYKVSGQTLLVVKGDEVIDLTSYAFMNARTKPEKLEDKIKTTINEML